MNPLTNMKNVLKLSEQELKNQSKSSWHDMYKDSAWIFVGGLPYDLTEGDIIAVFSQYGEIVNINLVRDKKSGKPKGFCFICYEDQRSTILSVDNLNGIKVLNRTLRVDHVHQYKVPNDDDKIDEETKQLRLEGCAPKKQIPAENIKLEPFTSAPNIKSEFGLPPRLPISNIKSEHSDVKIKNEKKSKKSKKSKKKKNKSDKKKKSKRDSSCSSDSSGSSENEFREDATRKSRKKDKKSKRKDSKHTESTIEDSVLSNNNDMAVKSRKARKRSYSDSDDFESDFRLRKKNDQDYDSVESSQRDRYNAEDRNRKSKR